MTNVDRNLGVSEPWGRATEKEIEDLKKRLRKLEGGRKVQAKTQSILADLVAKASVQDQLLQSQIDAQDIVTYADGPPDLGINEPDDSDVSEEDPGPVTGDEVDFDPGTDNDDDDDAGVPWEPDDGTPPEPEYRWIQEDPLRGVIEGEWVLVDGVWEPRQVGSDYVASGAIIRDKIEQAVLNDIDEANSNANEAVIAANGKNTNYRGPVEPTPPSGGFRPGDIWFDTSDPEGDVVINVWDGSDWVPEKLSAEGISETIQDAIQDAQDQADFAVTAANGKNTIYRGANSPTAPAGGFNEGDTWFDTSGGDTTIKSWSGSAWTVQEVGTESLAVGAITAESGIIGSLDAGVISVGTLDGDRIGANTITGSKILVGSVPGDRLEDGSITGTLIEDGAITTGKIAANAVTADEIAAGSITASSGIIASLDAGVISTGTLDADRIDSRSITADKLLIGGGAELYPVPFFDLGDHESDILYGPAAGPGSGPSTDAALPGHDWGYKLTQREPTTGTMSLYFPNLLPDKRIEVLPGEVYAAYMWVYATAPLNNLNVRAGNYSDVNLQIYGYADKVTTSEAARAFPGNYGSTFPGGQWERIGGQFTVPEGVYAITPRPTLYYPNGATPDAGDVYIGRISIVRAVGGTLIEDDAITTTKIAADAIEADHIKANAITAPKIGAGAVTARTLNVIAEENNRRLSILPDGVRLWGDVEAGGDPAIAITTTGAEYISITDGSDTVIGLDQSGTVTAQNLTVADDILLGALETDSALSQVIEDAPQGVIARYERNVSGETLNANSSTDGRMEFLEVEVDLYEGRVYRWDFDPLGVAMNYLSRAYIYAYFTTDGSKPTFDSDYRVLAYHIKRSEGHSSGDNIQMDGFRYFIPTSDLLGMRIMVGMRHNYGGTSTSALPSLRISTLSGMNAARFTITDLGARTYGDLGADRTRKVHPTSPTGGSSGSGGSDPAPKKTYTKTYNSTGGASYKSSGGRITTAPYAGRVTQGGGALGPHGEIHGAWFFGSPWSSDISGATIKKVELYITNQHSYSNAGLSARVHRHTNSNSSAPNTFTSGSLSNLKSFSFSKGQGKWVDVTSIFTSTTRGFGLKYSGTAQYGYFSNSARVRITYEK